VAQRRRCGNGETRECTGLATAPVTSSEVMHDTGRQLAVG
jgi:hypothetical protein